MASATCSPPASQDCECPAITAGLGPPARQWSLAGKAQALWLGVKIDPQEHGQKLKLLAEAALIILYPRLPFPSSITAKNQRMFDQ